MQSGDPLKAVIGSMLETVVVRPRQIPALDWVVATGELFRSSRVDATLTTLPATPDLPLPRSRFSDLSVTTTRYEDGHNGGTDGRRDDG
jgi:hypothetical protein